MKLALTTGAFKEALLPHLNATLVFIPSVIGNLRVNEACMGTMSDFWAKVNKTGNCWLWTGFVNEDGYGVSYLKCVRNTCHRIAWILTNGPIPPKMSVLHKCDIRNCVNPEHLFLGTQKDNVQDMKLKKRARNGVGTRISDIHREQIAFLRNCCGYKLDEIAPHYGTSIAAVSLIARGLL